MTDKITCPYCERSFDVDQAELAELMRQRAEVAAKLGQRFWRLANEYVDAFRASPSGRISIKRRARIIEGLAALVEIAEFALEGHRYRVDRKMITSALTAVCDAQKFGLKNHNYLKRALVSHGAERVSAQGLTAKQEQAIEAARLAKSRATSSSAALSSEEDEILSRDEITRRAREITNPNTR